MQAPAEPLNEMDQLKAVISRAKAAQAKYARFSQEQVRCCQRGMLARCHRCVSTLAPQREASGWLLLRTELLPPMAALMFPSARVAVCGLSLAVACLIATES